MPDYPKKLALNPHPRVGDIWEDKLGDFHEVTDYSEFDTTFNSDLHVASELLLPVKHGWKLVVRT